MGQFGWQRYLALVGKRRRAQWTGPAQADVYFARRNSAPLWQSLFAGPKRPFRGTKGDRLGRVP